MESQKVSLAADTFETPMKRRTYLATVGAVGVAGCLGDAGTGDDVGRADHPATASYEGAPWEGTEPAEAEDLIVGFEDPSCGGCRRFHESTYPELRSDLLGEEVAFVYRPYPIVLEWGEPASEAVAATADRDRASALSLLDRYYGDQSAFDADNVLERTASFLESETDVDGEAVVDDVESDAYEDVVQTHLDDGEAADVTSTPTFFLFSGDEFVTEVTGPQDAEVFRNALGR